MKFGDQVVRFEFATIPMVGNFNNGYAIGLTDEGAAICDRLLEEELDKEAIQEVDENLFNHLNQAGFFDVSSQPLGLQGAYLHVTQRCNLECVGCYSYDDARKDAVDAPLSSIKRALDELARGGVTTLHISGGEPFLRKDLADIVIYAKQDCEMSFVTVLSNGTCIDQEQLKKMAPYVDRVSVSFDGYSSQSPAYIRQQQRFDQLVEAIEAIKESGINAHIIATIHAKNIDDVVQYNLLAERLGVTLNLSLLSCPASSEGLGALAPDDEALKLLGKSVLGLGSENKTVVMDAPVGMNINAKQCCGTGRNTVSVGADGTVYPCHILHAFEFSMGNLFEDSIENIFSSETAQFLSNLSVNDFEDCKECSYRWVCGGGCRGRSYSTFGNLKSKDGYCSMIIEFYQGLESKLKKLYAR